MNINPHSGIINASIIPEANIVLSNKEKQPIYTALRNCIGELERLLVNSYELEARRQGTSVDPKKIEQGYQQLIKYINDAYNNNSNEDEKTIAFFDSPRHEALLKKPQNMLRALFHPNFENFVKLQLINHLPYTDKGSEIRADEFDKKIPVIKEFIILQLEIIITRNEQLLSLKANIKFLNTNEKISNQADITEP